MTVSSLLATTGRKRMAEESVRGFLETTEDHDTEVVAAVDNDPDTAEVLEGLGCLVDYSEKYRGASKAWNAALSHAKGNLLVLAADDLEWGPGWLSAALMKMDEFPGGWGLVGFNDGHWGDDLSTHYLMARRFVVEVLGGVVAWDGYKHSFNDREANARALMAGRYAWCKDAHVFHRHWIFGDRHQDETDSRLLGDHAESQLLYQARLAAGFPNDFPPAITK